MPTDHDERVIRRFGIAVVVAFGLATALPFVVALSTDGGAGRAAAAKADVAKSARVAVPAGRD